MGEQHCTPAPACAAAGLVETSTTSQSAAAAPCTTLAVYTSQQPRLQSKRSPNNTSRRLSTFCPSLPTFLVKRFSQLAIAHVHTCERHSSERIVIANNSYPHPAHDNACINDEINEKPTVKACWKHSLEKAQPLRLCRLVTLHSAFCLPLLPALITHCHVPPSATSGYVRGVPLTCLYTDTSHHPGIHTPISHTASNAAHRLCYKRRSPTHWQ